LPDERRASDIKLDGIERKLEEHSSVLSEMRDTLQQIAVQNYMIQSMQAQMTEVRGDINELYKRQEGILTFQAKCPRSHLNALWGVIGTAILGMISVFTVHIFNGSGK
jgi:hypothetical protein